MPLASDSYDELIEQEGGAKLPREEAMALSTIIPLLADWLLISELHEEYQRLRADTLNLLSGTTLRLWYPTVETDELLYTTNATATGRTFIIHSLSPDRDDAKVRLRKLTDFFGGPDVYSSYSRRLSQLVFLAARHFRTPIHPLFWEHHLLAKV